MRALAEARQTGIMKALEKAGEPDRVRDTLIKIVEKVDPLEVTAIMGVTVIVKQGIEWTEIPLENISQFFWLIGWLAQQAGIPDLDQKIQEELDSPRSELMQWIASFGAAFLIVRHFGQLVTAGTNLISLAKSMIMTPMVIA